MMDPTLSQLLLQGTPLWDCHTALEQASGGSDAGYYSGTGSLSPASSIDSLCFSPPLLPWGAADAAVLSDPAVQLRKVPSCPARGARRSRSKYPGKKRQNASEREKLRMRDLTKALHRLRTYLPPSLAPAGQTLTKIETLRLTIRYIAHLSAQLQLAEEAVSSAPLPGPQDALQNSDLPSLDSMDIFASSQTCSPQPRGVISPPQPHQI
ncbi:mesoderm posterior protein 2-like [Megalops cyprinoides]|uniref:mesoderm posterior protein 2-like n=1 Tax=Megalops cyprinoides TaxID=118141 RepID=UPI00186510D3|nr:mesoderm posterior protein 2-like [Megalops cyprinoides]